MLGESSNRGQLRDEEGYYQNIRLFYPLSLKINAAEGTESKRAATSNTHKNHKIGTCVVSSQTGNSYAAMSKQRLSL